LPEAAPPASLIAELSLGNPKQTWQSLRLLGGDLAQALPSRLPVLLATSLSLPPAAAGNLDETVPMVGVLLAEKDRAEPDAVLGMHVVSGAELVASLTLGDGAKFRRVELGPRLVRLVSAPGAVELDGALGVSGNYLLLATKPEALVDAGRFVAEQVSKRARTEPGITLHAGQNVLGGGLSRALREAWQARHSQLASRDRAEREAKGRAPDFADPEVLLAGADGMVESWLSVLETSREASLSLTPEADRLRVELLLTPSAEGAAALLASELVVGSSAPLLQLPASAGVGLSLRGDPQATEGSLGASLAKLFGSRLSEPESARLVKALDAFSKSRRGATTFGLVREPGPALLVRCELADGAAFSETLADVVSLLELPAINGWLAGTLGKPTFELSKARDGTRRAKLRFARGAAGAGAPLPKSLSLSWQARDGVGIVVASADGALEPSAFEQAAPLSSVSWFTQSPHPVFEHAALGLFADARLALPGGPDNAPILLSFGKKGSQIALLVDVSVPALSALARRFALDRSP